VQARYPDGSFTDERECRKCRGLGIVPTEEAVASGLVRLVYLCITLDRKATGSA
jgi:hypothetical protein